MALILTDEQKVKLSVQFLTAHGNPAAIDGAPVWASSDPTLVTIQPVDGDPNSVFAVTVGPVGTCQVSVTGDADLGPGVRNVAATIDLDIRAAEAVSAGITAGAPEDK